MVEAEVQQTHEEEPETLRSPYRVATFTSRPLYNVSQAIQQWINERAREGFVLHSITHSSVCVPRAGVSGSEIRATYCVVVECLEPKDPVEEL